uniref:RIKEN cDNA 4931422A03 gene n=1 Tax=Mus spicilegus TaxID=10103 RepID=A0A8C6GL81_MUSSI
MGCVVREAWEIQKTSQVSHLRGLTVPCSTGSITENPDGKLQKLAGALQCAVDVSGIQIVGCRDAMTMGSKLYLEKMMRTWLLQPILTHGDLRNHSPAVPIMPGCDCPYSRALN